MAQAASHPASALRRAPLLGAVALALVWASAAAAEPANSPVDDAAKGAAVDSEMRNDVPTPVGFLQDSGEALNTGPDTLTGRPAAPPGPRAAAPPSPARDEGTFDGGRSPLDTGTPYFNADWPTFWPPRFLP
jgi:hypothetical protein